MATVICVANQKGGVGKSSSATAIASILNVMGHKTLLIDADPQCDSTDTYRACTKDVATLYDVILDLDDPLPINEAIQTTEMGDIVASDTLLKESDTKFPNDGDEYFRLKEALAKLKGYEYVVIDTAPADNKLLKNCIVAADKLIIPIIPDRYSLKGLSELNKTINIQKKRNNPKLEISGLLLIQYNNRQKLSQDVRSELEDISKKMNTKVFTQTIRNSVIVKKAQAHRSTLITYAPKERVTDDYIQLVKELIN